MAKEELKIAGMKLMIEGGAQFTADLNTAKTNSKALSAELKLLEAGTTSAGKNGVEFLRAKTESLNAQLANQEQKTKILKVALSEATNATEVDAKQVAKLEAEVLKSQIAEEKLKVSLVNVTGQLENATNNALLHAKAQKEMGEKIEASGKQISSAGDNMTKYITVPAIAAAAALAALVIKSVETADSIQQTADVTGLSTDRIQELTYAGKDLDVELEVMTKSMAKQIKSMKAAQDGTLLSVDAYQRLGVEYKNSDGSLRDSEEVYWEVIESLSNMTNETERDALAMQLMGKSAMELNPLIKAGKDRIAELSAEAHKNGAVMSGESVAALDAFGDSVEKAKVSIGTAAGEIAVKMLPALEKLLPIVQKDIAPAIGKFAAGVGNLVAGFSNLNPVAKGVVATIAGLIVVAGPALKLVGTGITLYGTLTVAMAKHKLAVVANATATKGLAAAQGTAAVATKGLAAASATASAAMGPLIVIAAALAAGIVAVKVADAQLADAMENLDKTRAASAEKMAASETVVSGAISQVTSALDANTDAQDNNAKATGTTLDAIKSYGDAISESDAKMSEWDGGISKAQERLSELAAQVATESREYTKKEKEEIAALIDTIDLYTKEKAELYQKQMGTLALIIQQESDLTAEQITAYMGELNEFYEKSETYANESYARELVALQEKYGEEGELDTKAFDDGLTIAKNKRDLAIANAEEERDRVLEVLNDKAVKASEIEMSYFTNVTEADEKANALRKEKKAAWVEKMLELSNSYSHGLYSDTQYLEKIAKAEAEINATYDQQIIDADAAMADAITQSSSDSIAAKIESYRAMAAAGVTIAEEDLSLVNKYLDIIGEARIDIKSEANGVASDVTSAFSGMSKNAYQWGKNTIDRYLAGLKSSGSDGGTATQQILSGVARANGIKSYAVGTHYLEKDGLIFAHEGEAIIPKAENPYIKPAISLGSIATNRALSSVTNQSSVVNNSTTNAPVNLSMAGAVFNVRSQQDIDQIATLLAAKVAASKKAVGV